MPFLEEFDCHCAIYTILHLKDVHICADDFRKLKLLYNRSNSLSIKNDKKAQIKFVPFCISYYQSFCELSYKYQDNSVSKMLAMQVQLHNHLNTMV